MALGLSTWNQIAFQWYSEHGMFHKPLKQGLLERCAAVLEEGKKTTKQRYWIVKRRYGSRLALLEE